MVTVYSKNNCPYCVQAKNLLQLKGIEYEEVKIDESTEAREFIVGEGHRTVPQIYKDGKFYMNTTLTQIKEKSLKEDIILNKGINEFKFVLPNTGNEITFKLLTHGDEQTIEKEIQGLKKIDPKNNFEITARFRQMLLSINGDYDKKTIREFIEYGFLAKDSRALREYLSTISPGIDLKYNYVFEDGVMEDITIPIGINFFWPDA